MVFTAAPEKVADAVARGWVEPAPANGRRKSWTREVVVATMWTGPEVVGPVDPSAPPTPAQLDAIAVQMTPANCGVKPTVRVVDELAVPAFFDSGEPTCEEAHEDAWRWYVRRW